MSVLVDIITDSLTEIGQVGIGQSASAEQIAQGLRYANRMVGKWSIQRFMLYTVGTRTYVLTPNTQDYTVGPTGATFTATRPTFIQAAQIVGPLGGLYLPLNILDRTKWGAIRDRAATCSPYGLPQDVWPEYTFPNLTFHVWTIPSNACVISLSSWDPLQQFVTAFDQFNFPIGYEEAFMKNLAVALCPAYDMPVPQSLYAEAADGLVQIQRINMQSIGGALGESQTLQSPNLEIPPPTQPPAQPGGGA